MDMTNTEATKGHEMTKTSADDFRGQYDRIQPKDSQAAISAIYAKAGTAKTESKARTSRARDR